ncbi:MAG: hypothetical protein R3282_10620, partial [Rhodothermales bacterium]|nr:hypothetical protein [Rhodothermales bacterium]
MKIPRLVAFVTAASILSTGCDDPSPLSVDLIDTTSGAPEVVEISLGALPSGIAADVTGNARRSLAGMVDDPVVGRIDAAAGLDFASPVVLSDAFEEGPVTEAVLELARSYRFGDTTSTVQYSVRAIDEEWQAAGATSAGSIPFGAVITTGEISGSDTMLTIPLPSSWIEANSALIRSTNFANSFHGFYLEATSGNAVLGFSSQSSSFRVVSGEDTVNFVVSRNLTLLSRDDSGVAPPGTAVLQDGVGLGLEVDFAAAEDQLRDKALNRLVVRVPVDSLSAPPPPNFVRPRPFQVDLAGVTADSVVVTLAVSVQDEQGYRFESNSLNAVGQEILLGQSPF